MFCHDSKARSKQVKQAIETIARFVAERLRPIEAEVSENDAVPDAVLAEMRELGLLHNFLVAHGLVLVLVQVEHVNLQPTQAGADHWSAR